MANKLFLVSATLAFFFLLTNASIYRTVVEFDEDTNPIGPFRPQQRCRKQFQHGQTLRSCQQWIQSQTMQPSLNDEFDEGDSEQMPPMLRQCCNELQREDTECVCPALKQAAQAVRVQGQHGPFKTSQIYWTAKNLPNVCNIPRVDVCPFTAIPFFPPY